MSPLHKVQVTRKIDAGHRILNHIGKCRFLHGHTYAIEVTIWAEELLPIGFVVDFGDIKKVIDEWDHKTLLWDQDPLTKVYQPEKIGIIIMPFNPTAENMARHLAKKFRKLPNVVSVWVAVSETDSTKATAIA